MTHVLGQLIQSMFHYALAQTPACFAGNPIRSRRHLLKYYGSGYVHPPIAKLERGSHDSGVMSYRT